MAYSNSRSIVLESKNHSEVSIDRRQCLAKKHTKGQKKRLWNDIDGAFALYSVIGLKKVLIPFKKHLEAGKPFKIAFLGSNAQGEGKNHGRKSLRLH